MFRIHRNHLIKLAALAAFASASASAEMPLIRDEDPVTGVTTFSNFPICVTKQPSVPEAAAPSPAARNAIPAPPEEASHAAPTARHHGESRAGARDAGFPSIGAGIQRERDRERLTIIENELRAEQSALSEAMAKNTPRDIVRRHEANIAALQKEVDRLNDGRVMRLPIKRKAISI
jgi:hypothetical protein